MAEHALECGPIVLLCANRAIDAAAGARLDINWSHAFLSVLEKRGFTHLEVWEYQDLQSHPADRFTPGAFIVGPCRDGGLDPDDLARLRGYRCPLFIETAALAVAARDALGIRRIDEPQLVRLADADGGLRDTLSVFTPVLSANDAARCRVPLPSGGIKTRYEVPDSRLFRAAAADGPGQLAARLALKLAFSYCRRSHANENRLPFPDPGLSAVAAVALAIIADQLEAGADCAYLRATAARILEALPETFAGGTEDLVARLRQSNATSTVLAEPTVRRQLLATLPSLAPVFAGVAPGIADYPRTTTVKLAAAAICDYVVNNGEGTREILDWLIAHRLDPQKMAFAQISIDATETSVVKLVNHPFLLLALALGQLPLAACLPRKLTAAAMGLDGEQVRRWRQPPHVYADTTGPNANRTEVDAYLLHDSSCLPAVWAESGLELLGIPILAMLGYAHTLPPLDEAFYATDTHLALILEELFFRIIEGRLMSSARHVIRVAPWPDTTRVPLLLRHDVDRQPAAPQFERLLDLCRQRNLHSSWYWIADRLDPEWMRRLQAAGHENGLHALHGCAKSMEIAALAAADVSPSGECFHGAGAEYHRGGLSVLASAASGLGYSELHPCAYGFPYISFPWVAADGSLGYEDRLVHITFSTTTDGMPGQSRKTDYAADAEFALSTRRLSHYVCMLNHPDMNFESFAAFVERCDPLEFESMTAGALAAWWSATHRRGNVSVSVEQDALVLARAGPGPGMLIDIYGRDRPRGVMTQDGRQCTLNLVANGGSGVWRVQLPADDGPATPA